MDEMAITIEPSNRCVAPAALAAKIASELKSAFALRIPVSATQSGALPRFEMKAKRWVRL
jgi:phenylacetate-CoA ligase